MVHEEHALIRAVDAIQMPVPDLEAALALYRDRLGHALVWRDGGAAGLRMPDGGEIVLTTERPGLEPNFLVDSADEAARRFVDAGGSVLVAPHELQVGRLAVVQDPWGNVLVLLDMSKGALATDDQERITGNEPP